MEPKPVITIHGELELIGPVLQKTLQNKLKLLQKDGYHKEEKAFSSICNGVKFVEFRSTLQKPQAKFQLHETPCLHTYWSSCSTAGLYDKITRNSINDWIKNSNNCSARMIVYCVTAEVRSRRPKFQHMIMFGNKTEEIEEMIINDFGKYCNVANLRLASANEDRIADSFTSLADEINNVCLSEFLRHVSFTEDSLKTVRRANISSEELYSYICNKLSLAIAHEMIRNPTLSGLHYSTIVADLEASITTQTMSGEISKWLCNVRDAPIVQWNHPILLCPQQAWKVCISCDNWEKSDHLLFAAAAEVDLSDILKNKATILQIWSLLFTRQIKLLCSNANINQNMPACLQVANCCVSTLHSIARIINLLKVSIPEGVFNGWAFMTCMECLDSMMLSIDAEVLANTPSAMLILIRAELWHYAWEKLRSIGLLCNLMPGLKMEDHHIDIVDRVCSGIVIPYEDDNNDNFGKKLISILKSKDKFKTEFMSLGELVIGAFKMSGRRRMAFSIGTMMAEFHKDVGLVKEAEIMLCDVTSLHSVGQWPQLSSSAYTILAQCQKKLKEEDKQVNSLIVLVTTPKYTNAAHDPIKCMDQLMYIANVSKYQKLLSWEPLFDLDCINTDPVGHHQYTLTDTIKIKFKFYFYGPKSMELTSVNFLLESESQLTTQHNKAVSQLTTTTDQLDSLEEISLDPGPVEETLLRSRRIGGDEGSKVHKVYYTSNDIDGSDDVQFTRGLQLTCSSLVINPGINNITVSGIITSPGTYFPYHIILKSGALDFCLVVPTQKAKTCSIAVLHETVDINVALMPQTKEPVLLTGSTVLCQLRINTGEDTTIHEGSEILIKSPPNIELEAVKDATIQNLHSLGLVLPEIFPSGTTCLPFDFTATSVYDSEDATLPDCDFSESASLLSWQHELEVWCQWLTPPHLATLPLKVFEPFVFSHSEQSAGEDNTFLQLTVFNSCPLPLILLDHQLHTTIELVPLTGDKPTVFHPGDSFSFLWQHRKSTTSQTSVPVSVFSIDYHPQTNDDTLQQLSRTAKYKLKLSNMETIYSLKCSVQSLLVPNQQISVNHTVIITYTITNVTKDFRDSTQSPEKIHYSIIIDPSDWELNVQKNGTVQAPRIAQTVSFKIAATPKKCGLILVPSCNLVLETHNDTTNNTMRETLTNNTMRETLTNSRCYNTCQWHRIEVS